MQILDKYITRIFLSTFGVVLLFVLGVFVVIDAPGLIESLLGNREILRANDMTVAGVLGKYYLVSIPFFFLRLAPFVTLVAATIAVIRLMRGNELTAMVSAGRSKARITLPILVCGALLSLSMLAVQEWAIPRLAEARLRLDRIVNGDIAGRVDDLPAVQDAEGNTWRIEGYYPLRRRIEKVRVMRFADPATGALLGRLDIPVAHYRDEGPGGPGWYPEGGKLIPAEGTEQFGTVRDLPTTEPLKTSLLPSVIEIQAARRSREAGKMLSLTEAAELVRLYPQIPRQAVSFHSLLTWPLGTLLLLLLGLPFILNLGERNLFVGVGVALAICAAYFGVDTVCQDLGIRAVLPPVVAAWLPIVLFGSLAASLSDTIRSGFSSTRVNGLSDKA